MQEGIHCCRYVHVGGFVDAYSPSTVLSLSKWYSSSLSFRALTHLLPPWVLCGCLPTLPPSKYVTPPPPPPFQNPGYGLAYTTFYLTNCPLIYLPGWLHEPEAADVLHEWAPPAGDSGLAVGGGQRLPRASAEARFLPEQDPD